MIGDQLERGLIGDVEQIQNAVRETVGNSLGVQLPFDPCLYANALDGGQVTGTRAKRQPAERMTRALCRVQRIRSSTSRLPRSRVRTPHRGEREESRGDD
jgi:hypothetical protein